MIEVVFSESTKASIKKAKVYNEKDMQFEGQAIGGSSHDVVNIGFSLDVGDISGEIDGGERREIFKNIWNVNPNEEEDRQFFINQRQDLEKLITAAKEGLDIRIWRSSAPFSACGFAFVCNLLKDIDCNISVVDFPKYHHVSEDTVLTSATWNSVAPNEFYKFLSYEKEISNLIKQIQADLWETLKVENAPLRAVVNGKLISVPENFYDHLIIKNIPDGKFIMIRLIGQLVGEYELGVGDSWFAFRIKKMIEEGSLEVVSDKRSTQPYDIMLKK